MYGKLNVYVNIEEYMSIINGMTTKQDNRDHLFYSVCKNEMQISYFFLSQPLGEHILKKSIPIACLDNGISIIDNKPGVITHRLQWKMSKLLPKSGL